MPCRFCRESLTERKSWKLHRARASDLSVEINKFQIRASTLQAHKAILFVYPDPLPSLPPFPTSLLHSFIRSTPQQWSNSPKSRMSISEKSQFHRRTTCYLPVSKTKTLQIL